MIEYLKIVEERKINMKFLDAEFVKGFIRMANDGWEQGWHERNGGNLSYRVKPEEVESVKENFAAKEWQPIGISVPKLAGEYFLVTGSGKYFRNVIIKPEDSFCMIELETGFRCLVHRSRLSTQYGHALAPLPPRQCFFFFTRSVTYAKVKPLPCQNFTTLLQIPFIIIALSHGLVEAVTLSRGFPFTSARACSHAPSAILRNRFQKEKRGPLQSETV